MSLIALGTTSVLPQRLDDAFRLAAQCGYDGVEVMITSDRATQLASSLKRLSERHGIAVVSVHAPVLLFSSLVWGRNPLVKLARSAALAASVGARTVVAHPPYAWQRRSAARFVEHVREVSQAHGVTIAVENMFPVREGSTRDVFAPSWNPGELDVDALTLDFSHAGMSGRSASELASAWGERLRHVHLCDSSRDTPGGPLVDEHLVPGRGVQPVGEVLRLLAERDFDGLVVAEINTRYCGRDEGMRAAVLDETLRFARTHLRVDAS
ncbi:MAG: sugar phosphate isomerase/epimerase family protein [Microcella sp.]